jgi:hypothetical protein
MSRMGIGFGKRRRVIYRMMRFRGSAILAWPTKFSKEELTYAESDNPLAEPDEMIFIICISA